MFVDCRNAEKLVRRQAALGAIASRQRLATPAQSPSERSGSASSSDSEGSSCNVSFHVPFGRSRSWTPSPILPDLPPPAPSSPVPAPQLAALLWQTWNSRRFADPAELAPCRCHHRQIKKPDRRTHLNQDRLDPVFGTALCSEVTNFRLVVGTVEEAWWTFGSTACSPWRAWKWP
jgi:hypothetical protein